MKKRFNNIVMKIMIKTLPLIKYYPFKLLGPAINKSVNWYMQKRFPMPKAQPTDQSAQTPPPAAEEPKA